MFLFNNSDNPLNIQRSDPWLFDGQSPEQLLTSNDWAWHESPSTWETDSTTLPPRALIVLPFNGRSSAWGVDTTHTLKPGPRRPNPIQTLNPALWLSADQLACFPGDGRIKANSVAGFTATLPPLA